MHTLASPPQSTITHDAHDLVILCDKSFSMRDVSPTTGRSRISILNETLRAILPQLRSPMLLEFAREVQSVQRRDEWLEIRADGDGTRIATALRTARLLNPCRVILITDGEPTDDPAESLLLAGTMVARIDAYYCGEPNHASAVAFLRALVAANQRGGHVVVDPCGSGMVRGVQLLLTAPIV